MSEVRTAASGSRVRIRSRRRRARAAVQAPFHGLEQARVGVLEGDIEVAADLRPGHGVEEAPGDLLGVAVEEADPRDAGDAGKALEQAGQSVPDAAVPAEPGRVVGDEVDLPDPEAGEGARFADDRGRAPRDIASLDEGDGAEGAAVRTALRDLDVGPGPRRGDEARRGVGIEERPVGNGDRTARDDGGDLVEAPRRPSRRRRRGTSLRGRPGPSPRSSRRR